MIDRNRLIGSLTSFAETVATRNEVTEVLEELVWRLTSVVAVRGATVLAAPKAGMHFLAASDQKFAELAANSDQGARGPERAAQDLRQPVVVPDLRAARRRWPRYVSRALDAGVGAVAAVPVEWADASVGAVALYQPAPYRWHKDEVATARTFAYVTSFSILQAAELDESRRLDEQLRHALASRITIEQAKGIISEASHVGIDQAFKQLRRYARTRHASIHEVADAVVERRQLL